MTTTKKTVGEKAMSAATDNFKFPVTFKEFKKNPIVGTMFLVIVGISALYIDIRGTFNNQISSQAIKIEKLELKVDVMSDAIRRADSALASTTTKISLLEQLGKISK